VAPMPSWVNHWVKKAAGHYHIVTDTGDTFWVAKVRVEDFDGRRSIWQVGVVAKDGFEDAPFDASPTMWGCLQYTEPVESMRNNVEKE
jgi:hypothetical protein